MLLLVVMLLSNCSKLNFSKGLKFSSSLKPYGEEGEENQNNTNSVNKNKNVDYVIGRKQTNSKKKILSDISNIKVDYSEAKTLLEIKEEERKSYEKEIKDWENQNKINVDYSKAKTLLDFQREEQKAKEKFERDRRFEEKKEYSTSNQNEHDFLQYGYEETIYGYESNFFC